MAETIKGKIVDNNVFIYPRDEELTISDLLRFIGKNNELAKEYQHNLDMYEGNHDILHNVKRVFGCKLTALHCGHIQRVLYGYSTENYARR